MGSSILAAAAAGVSLFVMDRQPELDAVMSEQLEVATHQRMAALVSSATVSRDTAVAAYGDGDSDATGNEDVASPAVPDYSQVPRHSIAVESSTDGSRHVADAVPYP